jgi:hypothetical protein
MPMEVFRKRFLTTALMAVSAACNGTRHPAGSPADTTPASDSRLVSQSIGELVHELRITPAEPVTGDTLEILSTVINRGAALAEIGSVICGLDLVTMLTMEPVVAQCEAVGPVRFALAPGDSARIGPVPVSGGIVRSGPGRYAVRARHLLEPELWTEFEIVVRSP